APNALCLMNCSLGCSSTGCQITDIAQNEIITWEFNKDVDPVSVNDATIRFRTVSGDVPVGDFLVTGQIVQFVPRAVVIGGQSFFGFRAGETYSMHMGGGTGDPNVIRSTSGTTMPTSLNCTLNVTRGVVDHNGAPPSATLISPTVHFNVQRDVTIVIE